MLEDITWRSNSAAGILERMEYDRNADHNAGQEGW